MCKGILSAHSLSKIKTQINKNCCLPMKRQRQRETKRERNKERNAENNSRKKAATASVAYITAVFSVICQYQLTPPPSTLLLAPILFWFIRHLGEGSGGISRDEFIDQVAAGILKKLPPAFETWRIRKMMAMSMSPTGVVLLQELDRFNLLVVRMKKTLELLRKVSACQRLSCLPRPRPPPRPLPCRRRRRLSIDDSSHKSFSFVLHFVFIHLPSWPVTKEGSWSPI